MVLKIIGVYNKYLTQEFVENIINKLKLLNVNTETKEDNINNTPYFIFTKHNKEILKIEGKVNFEIIYKELKNIGHN